MNSYLKAFAFGLVIPRSLVLAVLFGIGTALFPMSLLGGVIGWLLGKISLFEKRVSVVRGARLAVLGFRTLTDVMLVV
jgi:hypothetical protein